MFTITRCLWNQTPYKFGLSRHPLQSLQNMRFSSFRPSAGGNQRKAQLPQLFIERPNGTEESIVEEDLHRYMRHRWLFNEQTELSKHYLRFNLPKPLDIAVHIVGNGAQSCIKVLKCSEGLHNKAFILTIDNGLDVFAKLPNPNAGPARYTTATEVATRQFDIIVARSFPYTGASDSRLVLRCKKSGWGRIYHRRDGPGHPTWQPLAQWPREIKLKIITQVAQIEHSLTSVCFPKHGCIYFKEDLFELTGVAPDLSISSVVPGILNRFSIGPLSMPELWTSGRASMDLDRGPWRNSREYTQAMGRNEIAWIESHATPRMNFYRSSKEPELPEEVLSLLGQYMKAAPFLVPRDTEEENSTILWHPDLHLDNVFVDPGSYKITSIVDWQSAAAAPLFFQCGVPKMFRHSKPVRDGWVVPERPGNFETLNEEEKSQIDEDLESETIHKYYEAQVYKHSPRHWAALQQKTTPILRKPVWLVSGVWENRDLFFLRQSLISLAAHWEKLRLPDVPVSPVKFSKEELELHAKEEDNMDGIGRLLTHFRDQGVLPVDGMVEPGDYETAKENSRKFKKVFVGLAADQEERELFSKLWPYQDLEG